MCDQACRYVWNVGPLSPTSGFTLFGPAALSRWATLPAFPVRTSLNMSRPSLLPVETIQQHIFTARGKRVLLDADLARFYGVTTSNLNKAVTRNLERFPDDFSFHLTSVEVQNLKFQFGISSTDKNSAKHGVRSNGGHGGSRKPPRVFTEQGVAMLASVLRSKRAATVNVAIVRAFVRLREMLAGNRELAGKLSELERKIATHDGAIRELFDAIRQLLLPAEPGAKREIGFHAVLAKRKGWFLCI